MTTHGPEVTGYHAHVYYDDASRADAAAVREALDTRFTVKLGRWRDAPVGPHPEPMYQVAFAPDQFDGIVRWLMPQPPGTHGAGAPRDRKRPRGITATGRCGWGACSI